MLSLRVVSVPCMFASQVGAQVQLDKPLSQRNALILPHGTGTSIRSWSSKLTACAKCSSQHVLADVS